MIDLSYFYGKIAIPGIATDKSVQREVEQLIAQYEKEYLEKVLGYSFKKLYDDGITADDQIYVDIRDGAEYNSQATGYLTKWSGLKKTSPVSSPIANYIYYHYMKHNATVSTRTGGKVINQPTAVHIGDSEKAMFAWSDMVDENWVLRDFLRSQTDVYPDYRDTSNDFHGEMFRKINMFQI